MINLFCLDNDISVSASYTYDIHLRQQIVELVQVVFNVRYVLKLNHECFNFKYRHRNHVFTKWATCSMSNYLYVVNYCYALQYELYHRGYNKKHKCIQMLDSSNHHVDYLQKKFMNKQKTIMPQYMPDVFKTKDVCLSYRLLYYFLKRYKLPYGIQWTNRENPYWYCDNYFLNLRDYNILNIVNGDYADYIKPKIVF